MLPKRTSPQDELELFRSRLENIIDRRHPLVRLARLIDWPVFEGRFGALYVEGAGRPGLPTRLMVALHLLKHMDGLSDDAVCARHLDSPYVQAFCGETHFQHALPLDRSSMTRWRQRVGAERMEVLLAETVAAAERAEAIEDKHCRRVSIDATVQPKAIAHPTDSKLAQRGTKRWPGWRASTASPCASPTAGSPATRSGRRRACTMAANSARPRPACASCAPGSADWRATSPARSTAIRGKDGLRRDAGSGQSPAPPEALRPRRRQAPFPARA